MNLKIVSRGVVFQSIRGTDRQSCAFPDMAVMPDGRWLCSFRAAPTKAGTAGQHPVVVWSDDEGRTWFAPTAPFRPPSVDDRPGLFRKAAMTAVGGHRLLAILSWVDHSDPSLPFFNTETEGLLDTRLFLAESGDAGQTWTQPVLLNTSPFDVPTPLTGPILRMANGHLACQFELNKHYGDSSEWRHAPMLMFSEDGGRTWGEPVVVAQDPTNRVFYWDQRPSVLPDGQVLNVFWTYDVGAAAYRNITACRSSDHGRTWSGLWDTGVPGQPAPPVPLGDGIAAMVYVERSGSPRIVLRASRDGGLTWPRDTEIALFEAQGASQSEKKRTMQDAWAEMGAFSIGLPSTARCPNGDVLVAYYAGSHTDRTDIHWVRVART